MKPLLRKMACMTICTQTPQDLATLLEAGLGWDKCVAGDISPAMKTAWGLPPDAPHSSFQVYRSPGCDRGMIRIVDGEERWPSRPIGARWSGAEIVAQKDIDDVFRRMEGLNIFQVGKAPDNADFTDVGANIHRFFYGRGPGGTHFMLTAAITEARDYDFPASDNQVGYIFSIPLVSTDYASSFAFYTDSVGMIPTLEDKLNGGIWHKTWSLPEGTPVELSILKGDAPGFGLGGIELQGYPTDVVDPVEPPETMLDGGASLATFTATDLDLAHARLSTDPRVRRCTTPQVIDGAPYGSARSFTIVGPGGERLELVDDWTIR